LYGLSRGGQLATDGSAGRWRFGRFRQLYDDAPRPGIGVRPRPIGVRTLTTQLRRRDPRTGRQYRVLIILRSLGLEGREACNQQDRITRRELADLGCVHSGTRALLVGHHDMT